jgi:hypothetical protein
MKGTAAEAIRLRCVHIVQPCDEDEEKNVVSFFFPSNGIPVE